MPSDAGQPGRPRGPQLKPPAFEAAERRDWPAYFDRTEHLEPRHTLARALDLFEAGPPADAPPGTSLLGLDLAAGAGRDTQLMLERGWRVLAIEPEEDGVRRLRTRAFCGEALGSGHLEILTSDFAAVARSGLPEAHLVNASFALPFCPKGEFPALWRAIDAAIPEGGRFAGQFFGDRDSWSIKEDRTHLTRASVLDLFARYQLNLFEEEDRPAKSAGSAHKHWHVFHVVATKQPR